MSFRNGKMNVRWFALKAAGVPEDAAKLFAERGVGALEQVKELAFGWSTYDSLFEGKITDANAWLLEFLRLNLVKVTKKVPAGLLRVEVQAAMERRKKETGKTFLSKQEKKEIKAGIRDMLLTKMPPHLTGCEVVHRRPSGIVAAEALSVGAADRLAQLWRSALGDGQVLHALTPDVLAKAKGFEARQVSPAVFNGRKVPDDVAVLGPEFAVWLWATSETSPEILRTADGKVIGVLIQGPLSFSGFGDGALRVKVADGSPTLSPESKAALLDGKKLDACTLSMSIDAEVYSASWNTLEFTFRGLRVPMHKDMLDAVSDWQDRMDKLDAFRKALVRLYTIFLHLRFDAARWKSEEVQVAKWIAGDRWMGGAR